MITRSFSKRGSSTPILPPTGTPMPTSFRPSSTPTFPEMSCGGSTVSASSPPGPRGVDHIDMDWCSDNDIGVANVPSYGENTVAEHVFALLLAISRNIVDAADRTRRG